MAKTILVNLPFEKVYKDTKMVKMTHYAPPLSLAAIGASLLEDKHKVKIFDLNLPKNNLQKFKTLVEEFEPEYVGISFVTPLFSEMLQVVNIIKDTAPRIITIGGGAHCSSYPKGVLQESHLDIVVIGEGDVVIKDIVNQRPLDEIRGIAYRDTRGQIIVNKRAKPIEDLDSLPYPAYNLYEMEQYEIPKTLKKESPVAWMESSRGCIYRCVYCNKSVFGTRFRTKSPERVVNEMIRLKKLGFKEVHFTDDAFTTDIGRAKRISQRLIESRVDLSWALITGVRVDQLDLELLTMMKKAGCYRLFLGIESGNQRILNNIRKGITLRQVVRAVDWAKRAGIEVWGAFMIGLPGETEESMQDTIEFAKQLPLDLAKVSILIPLPATPIYEEWNRRGILKTKDWNKFCFYSSPAAVYDHPDLSWGKIMKYYDKFYHEFYFRPSFLFKRLKHSVKNKTILDDIKVCLGTKWFQSNVT